MDIENDNQEASLSPHYTNENWDGNSFHGKSFEPRRASIRDYKKAVERANLIFGDDSTDDVSSSPNVDGDDSSPQRMSYADFLKSAKDMSTTNLKTRHEKAQSNAFQQLVKQGESATSDGEDRSSEPIKPNGKRMPTAARAKQGAKKATASKIHSHKRVAKHHSHKHRVVKHRELGDSASVSSLVKHSAHKQHVQKKAGKQRFHSHLLEMGADDSDGSSAESSVWEPTINLLQGAETATMDNSSMEAALQKVEAAANQAVKAEAVKQKKAVSTKALRIKLTKSKAENKAFAQKVAELEHTALEQA
jgi:hypothetical protein